MWNSTAPDGAKSVKQNEAPLQENTTYIEEKMGNTANDTTNDDAVRDHFWDVDANLDGRHRYINAPAYTISGTEEDPDLGAGMGGTLYFKTKTATESPTQQDVQPFFRNAADIMQMGAFRAIALASLAGAAITEKYLHNVPVNGIVRNNAGDFTVTFDNALPSVDYLVFGGCTLPSSNPALIGIFRLSNVNKTTGSFDFYTVNSAGTRLDPNSVWFVVLGG